MVPDRNQALLAVRCTEGAEVSAGQALEKCLLVNGPEEVDVRSVGLTGPAHQAHQLAVSWEV